MAINIPIITDYDSKGVRQAQKSFEELRKQTGKVGASIKSVMLPAAAAVGALAVAGVSAVKAAVQDQRAQALLAQQLRVSTKATDAQIDAVEKQITAMALASGIADDELRPAFASLARATGSTSKSTRALRVAMNVAAATGKPLNRVVESMARAYGGNVKALARLDPSLRSFITKTTTADQAVAQMASTFRTASDVQAATLEGRMARLRVAFSEVQEEIGYALLPAFEKLIDFIQQKVLPYARDVAEAYGKDGMRGVFKKLADDGLKIVENLDGVPAILFDTAAALTIMFAAFKGITGWLTFVGTLKGLAGLLSSIGGAFAVFAGVTTSTLLTAFALVALAIGAVITALRNPMFRQEFGEVLINSAKLVANAFVAMYKIVQNAVNPIIRLMNRVLPKQLDIPLLPNVSFEQFTFDAGRAPVIPNRSGTTPDAMSGGVVINVNGGDPNAVVDALTKWYRQNGPLPVATRG